MERELVIRIDRNSDLHSPCWPSKRSLKFELLFATFSVDAPACIRHDYDFISCNTICTFNPEMVAKYFLSSKQTKIKRSGIGTH